MDVHGLLFWTQACLQISFKVAKENGLKKLMGRVSTRNVSALNLYVAMGATFEKPVDVYLREG